MSKAKLAELMHTSRNQIDRILNAKGNVTIETLQRAASFVGRQLRLELFKSEAAISVHPNASDRLRKLETAIVQVFADMNKNSEMPC